MFWLVGQDWGFLVRLAENLAKGGSELVVVAVGKVAAAAKLLDLDRRFVVVDSLGKAT
jgi:hypothetical protein